MTVFSDLRVLWPHVNEMVAEPTLPCDACALDSFNINADGIGSSQKGTMRSHCLDYLDF